MFEWDIVIEVLNEKDIECKGSCDSVTGIISLNSEDITLVLNGIVGTPSYESQDEIEYNVKRALQYNGKSVDLSFMLQNSIIVNYFEGKDMNLKYYLEYGLTVYDNIYFSCWFSGMIDKMSKFIKTFGFKNSIYKKVKDLKLYDKIILLIAITLLRKPKVFCINECISSSGTSLFDKLASPIISYSSNLIVGSNSKGIVKHLKRIVLMSKGKVVFSGKIDDLKSLVDNKLMKNNWEEGNNIIMKFEDKIFKILDILDNDHKNKISIMSVLNSFKVKSKLSQKREKVVTKKYYNQNIDVLDIIILIWKQFKCQPLTYYLYKITLVSVFLGCYIFSYRSFNGLYKNTFLMTISKKILGNMKSLENIDFRQTDRFIKKDKKDGTGSNDVIEKRNIEKPAQYVKDEIPIAPVNEKISNQNQKEYDNKKNTIKSNVTGIFQGIKNKTKTMVNNIEAKKQTIQKLFPSKTSTTPHITQHHIEIPSNNDYNEKNAELISPYKTSTDIPNQTNKEHEEPNTEEPKLITFGENPINREKETPGPTLKGRIAQVKDTFSKFSKNIKSIFNRRKPCNNERIEELNLFYNKIFNTEENIAEDETTEILFFGEYFNIDNHAVLFYIDDNEIRYADIRPFLYRTFGFFYVFSFLNQIFLFFLTNIKLRSLYEINVLYSPTSYIISMFLFETIINIIAIIIYFTISKILFNIHILYILFLLLGSIFYTLFYFSIIFYGTELFFGSEDYKNYTFEKIRIYRYIYSLFKSKNNSINIIDIPSFSRNQRRLLKRKLKDYIIQHVNPIFLLYSLDLKYTIYIYIMLSDIFILGKIGSFLNNYFLCIFSTLLFITMYPLYINVYLCTNLVQNVSFYFKGKLREEVSKILNDRYINICYNYMTLNIRNCNIFLIFIIMCLILIFIMIIINRGHTMYIDAKSKNN